MATRNTAPANENGADKFRRLAKRRVESARKAINAIGSLADKRYDYTPEQVENIGLYLKGVVDGTLERFKKQPELDL